MGYLILSEELDILYMNSFVENASGLKREAWQGKKLTEIYPVIKNTRLHKMILRGIDRNESSILTPSLNSQLFPLIKNEYDKPMIQSVYISPIRLENNKYLSIQIKDETSVSIRESLLREKSTHEKRLNEELKIVLQKKQATQDQLMQKTDELETINQNLIELNKEKNEFLSIVAHDLKNPLSVIRSLSDDVLEDFPGNVKIQSKIQIIRDSTMNMIALVTNLLDTNTIESGILKSIPVRFDPIHVIERIIEMHLIHATKKNIKIIFKKPQKTHSIVTDQRSFYQVIDNLLSNSLKFSFKNSEVAIHVSFPEGKGFRVRVIDRGPGISQKDRSNLFKKFSKLTPRPTAGETSNGLGLFIVHKIADSIQGSVSCWSKLKFGSVFQFEVPIGIETIPNEKNQKNYHLPHNDISIMILDDESISGRIMNHNLLKLGYRSQVFMNPIEAIERIQREKFDIIFMDLNMPEMNGKELVTKIKDLEITEKPYLILMSGEVSGTNQKEFLDMGFDDCLPKDFQQDSIKRVLEGFREFSQS
ncbi:MAG: response regulator [Leptospiraceae bacterium]|nr:response regulator [Leptospiraceae bacterium]MCP5512793.1 response regulator [Leptospiraceae bacterium]